jgi:hypothetical protein
VTDRAGARLVLFVAAAACVAYIAIYAGGLAWPPIRSDGFSYYVYLPSWFIFHDPTFETLSRDCCGGAFPQWSTLYRWPATGAWMNPHPMAIAIMASPFFLVAHALTRWSNLSPDGFSLYYQVITGLAGAFYLGLGVWFLRRVLRRHFDPGVTFATLAAIVWGTNLFHYATYDSLFSHVYAFCLFAALLDLTPRWLERPSAGRSAALGLVAGLLVITRLAHVLLLLFVVLYGVTSVATLRTRATFVKEQWRPVLILAGCVALVLLPQLAMYRHATGQWLASPYGPNWWFVGSPKILEVLFSTQKGLFFWSPLLLLSVAGFQFLPKYAPQISLPTQIVLLVQVYMVASWFDWQFGGSYGHRAFTDVLPVFAIGLAALFARVRRTRWRLAVSVAATLAVALSIVQMIQYWLRIIPFSGTTWETYRSIFLRFSR